MKLRLLSVLLIFCLLLTAVPVFAAGGSAGGGGGGTASGGTVKPFIPNYEYFHEPGTYYGFFDQDSLYDCGDYIEASLYHSTPDGGMDGSGAEIGLYTKVNGRTYSSLSQLMAAIPLNVPVQVVVDEIQIDEYGYTDGIVEINADATPVSYYGKTYSPTTGTFAGVSANVADNPVYYCVVDQWDGEVWYNWYYPYLDGNHTYDINVYDYGIVITNMQAIGKPVTLMNIATQTKPNGKMLSNIQVECWPDYNLTGYAGELYAKNGTKLQSKNGTLDQWSNGFVTFTDLPVEAGSYTIKVWGLSGNAVVTPVYTYAFEKEAARLYEGTVTKIEDETDKWGQKACVYLQIDDDWEREISFPLPVEVGDTLCTTVSQLMNVMPVGSYVTYASAGFGDAFRVGESETVYDNYGAISRFQIAYNTVDEYVRVELALPDGTFGEYQIYSGAKMGDEKLNDINEIYDYIKRNNGMPATFQEEDGVITHFTVGEGSTNYSRQSYREYSEEFSDLSKKENKLPVYYTYNNGFYPTYLNSEHYYDLMVYQYGVVITDMYAKYMQETVKSIEANASGSRNLLMNLGFFCNVSGGTTLVGKLYDAKGRDVAETSVEISNGEGDLVFTDLPNQDAEYRYLIWAEDSYGSMITPYYEKDITVEKLPSGSGTIEAVQVNSGNWSSEGSVLVRIKTTSSGTLDAETAERFYIDGERYRDTDEILALLQAGTVIEYIGDEEGKLVAVKRTNAEPLSYGSVYSYSQNSGMIQVGILDADGTVKYYTVDEYCWLNGHFMGSFDNLHNALNYASSCYVAYRADGEKLTALKTGSQSQSYAELTYSSSSRKFSGLPDSSKNLPIYYSVAEMAADPILNENHVYDVILHDYAIEIVNMKAKDMDATICYLDVSSQLNSKFFRDIKVEVLPYLDVDGTVVKAQLLDSKGHMLAETSQETNAYRFMNITFPNLPNQDAEYRMKLWVENASGTRISPNYTKKFTTAELDITYGTIAGYQSAVDEYGDPCVVLKITIPGLDEPVYVTCPLGTVVNGTEIWSENDLQTALPVGTMIKVAEDGDYVSQIQTVTTTQAISKPVVNGTTVSAGITTVNNSGKTMTGTAYVSVYNKDNLLKKLTSQPFTLELGAPAEPVPVEVEGITYQEGDYLKVVCMDENGVPMCDMMKVDIE